MSASPAEPSVPNAHSLWLAGSIAAARFELRKLTDALGDEPVGVSRVSVYASDLYALIHAAQTFLAIPASVIEARQRRNRVTGSGPQGESAVGEAGTP